MKTVEEIVTRSHGAGGKASRRLVEDVFLARLGNPLLDALGDAAVGSLGDRRLALTTDAYVVKPLVFPGGDIGSLAVNGTVNDLAVSGAEPVWLAAAFVIEEGFDLGLLGRLADSLAEAAAAAGVQVVAGDTKVVEHGKGDGLYVATAGVGLVPAHVALGPERVEPGDAVLVSGTLADHGTAVMIARGELRLEAAIASDTAPLNGLVRELLPLGRALRWMRDPTRGGLATSLNELAAASGLGVRLHEDALPVRADVAAACELLGIDPLYVANEGKLVAVVDGDAAGEALSALRSHPLGRDAAVVGSISADELVVLETTFGGNRIVDMLVGDPLPRIC